MTCRHSATDPNCSSNRSYSSYTTPSATPDASNYQVLDIHREGPHIVLKVKYPNCKNCAYEGTKVMVFLNVSEKDLIMWRKIDPHFGDPKIKRPPTEAPSPEARFPATDKGWRDALTYVQRESSMVRK